MTETRPVMEEKSGNYYEQRNEVICERYRNLINLRSEYLIVNSETTKTPLNVNTPHLIDVCPETNIQFTVTPNLPCISFEHISHTRYIG